MRSDQHANTAADPRPEAEVEALRIAKTAEVVDLQQRLDAARSELRAIEVEYDRACHATDTELPQVAVHSPGTWYIGSSGGTEQWCIVRRTVATVWARPIGDRFHAPRCFRRSRWKGSGTNYTYTALRAHEGERSPPWLSEGDLPPENTRGESHG